jgi:hypothetical protein
LRVVIIRGFGITRTRLEGARFDAFVEGFHPY